MTRAEFDEKLVARAEAAGADIHPAVLDALWTYFHLLSTWNQKINLTAVNLRDLSPGGVDRLFVEPIVAARYAPPNPEVIDIGSGGGSPALPFALAAQARNLTMVESRTRKSVFLREAARTLGLNHDVVTARFQDLAVSEDYRGAFDVVTLRAVRIDPAALAQLREFARPGGELFLFEKQPSEATVANLTATGSYHLTAEAKLSVWRRGD